MYITCDLDRPTYLVILIFMARTLISVLPLAILLINVKIISYVKLEMLHTKRRNTKVNKAYRHFYPMVVLASSIPGHCSDCAMILADGITVTWSP